MISKRHSDQSKKDLIVLYGWGFLLDPIVPLAAHKVFISDAAGQAANCSVDSGPGVASVGFDEDGKIIFAHRISWPQDMIRQHTDGKGVRMGDKSTTLEMVGLLLPWLSIPHLLKNLQIFSQ